MEYTFEDWLNGKAEPRSPFWKYDLDNNKLNSVYRQIAKAKKNTFDWSLEGIIHLGKSDFLDKMNGLTQSRKKTITEKMIVDSKKYFEGYEKDKLIYQDHPKKFDGIDGKKYSEVKKAYEDFKDGINLGFAYLRNDFFEAVLHFELNEFYQDFLQNDCKDLEPEQSENPSINHSQKTRIDIEPKYRFYLLERLEMIDPKGIFYNSKLSLNDRAKLLSKILGYNIRDSKDLLNGKMEFNNEKLENIDDFLNSLTKKSEI